MPGWAKYAVAFGVGFYLAKMRYERPQAPPATGT